MTQVVAALIGREGKLLICRRPAHAILFPTAGALPLLSASPAARAPFLFPQR